MKLNVKGFSFHLAFLFVFEANSGCVMGNVLGKGSCWEHVPILASLG